jgi:Sulfotransferase family
VTGLNPVFVLGAARSGTTLLSLMLDSHSRLAIPYESHFFLKYHAAGESLGDFRQLETRRRVVSQILNEPYVRDWDAPVSPGQVNLDACNSLPDCINQIYLAYAKHFGKDRWGDKTPRYTGNAHVLNAMFPQAMFIHLIRDGRDVALSIVEQWWGPSDWCEALQQWTALVACTRKMLAMLPADRVLELRFEDLVREPEKMIRQATAFLDLTFEPAMLDAYRSEAAAKVGSRISRHHASVQSAPDIKHLEKWRRRLSRVDQSIASKIAGPLLAELEYPTGAETHWLRPLRIWQRTLAQGIFRRWRGISRKVLPGFERTSASAAGDQKVRSAQRKLDDNT